MLLGFSSQGSAAEEPCTFDPAKGPDMVVIEPGTYVRGSPETEKGRSNDEGPQQQVSIQAFALSRCEITVAQFQPFVDETGYKTDAEKETDGNTKGCFTFTENRDDNTEFRI